MAIGSFRDARTRAIWLGESVRVAADVARRARNKLQTLDAATTLQDLRSPPGNDLKRRSDGLWQIRVNDQYRILFSVVSEAPLRVEDVWFGDPH